MPRRFFSQRLAGQARDATWAIVADEAFEHALRFESHIKTDVRRIIVFNDPITACIWLGVEPADVRTIIDELHGKLRRSDLGDQPRRRSNANC
jgi:hypothetical protein